MDSQSFMQARSSWTDTHVHLADKGLRHNVESVLTNALGARVHRLICVGVDAEASTEAVRLSRMSQSASANSSSGSDDLRVVIWASVGIHPNHAQQEREGDWESILKLSSEPEVCAVGETGLDRYWDDCPFCVQQRNFDRHWELSRATGLPVIIHSRDCDAEMLEALRTQYRQGPLRGVMHSFCSDLRVAEECISMGLYISFSGMLTYKKNDALREVAARLPLDRLLVETDAPYLSPEPKRSVRPNEPSLVVHTGAVLADLFGLTPEKMSEVTTKNALRLFSKMR